MKYLFFAFTCLLVFTQCCEESTSEEVTHHCKGEVQHAITGDLLTDIDINVVDKICPFSIGTSCKSINFNKTTSEEGNFNFIYYSCCDVVVKFELSDSLEDVLGKCYRWEYEDLNENPVQIGGCSRDHLMTVRGTKYNFLVTYQPQLFVRFKPKENEALELQKIEIESLGIVADSLTFLSDFYDISKLKDDMEVKITYSNDSIVTQFLEYDYVKNCNEEITIEI